MRSLPKGWTGDAAWRAAVGMSAAVAFRTKPALARAPLERALAAGVPAGWVTGDAVDGGDRWLRGWPEEQERPHVPAVKAGEPLWAASERGPARVTAADLAARLPREAWVPLNAGDGARRLWRLLWAPPPRGFTVGWPRLRRRHQARAGPVPPRRHRPARLRANVRRSY